MNKRSEKKEIKQIALERISILLEKSDEIYPSNPSLAQKYGAQAKKIAMKARIQMPKKWHLRFCKKCKNFLYPGINCHIRIKPGKPKRVILFCHLCQSRSHSVILKKSELDLPQTKTN